LLTAVQDVLFHRENSIPARILLDPHQHLYEISGIAAAISQVPPQLFRSGSSREFRAECAEHDGRQLLGLRGRRNDFRIALPAALRGGIDPVQAIRH
jgi:hypothetical protein